VKLLVVILNYKVTDLTIDCLRSLDGRIDRVPGARVVVCENGTGTEDVERLRTAIDSNNWGRWAQLVAIHPNRGFTGGNNFVIRQAFASADPPELVLLLNADTIVRDGALEALVEFMDSHPRAGIAASLLFSPEGDVQASGFRFPSIQNEFERALRFGVVTRLFSRWNIVLPHQASPTQVDWVSGASEIFRRKTLEEIGLLDEGLYTYFDDPDMGVRARRAGWETWLVPESQVVHLEGRSTGIVVGNVKRRPLYWFQARRRFFLKSYGPFFTAGADAAHLVGHALWRVGRWIQRKPDTDPPHYLGDFFRQSVFVQGFKVPVVENPAIPRQAP
jgi:N-acetylglucosaminyl-diphospho-decaprenol L-rhamnosyltransferase